MHLSYMKKKANIVEVLRLVGLENVNQKPIAKYSLGMKQRLGLARAIIHQPKLLIIDEPLNGLDPIAITEMRELMKKLTGNGMSNFTVLISSILMGILSSTVGIISTAIGWKKTFDNRNNRMLLDYCVRFN